MNPEQFPIKTSMSRILAEDVGIPELRHTAMFEPRPHRMMAHAVKLFKRLIVTRFIRKAACCYLRSNRAS